MAAKRPKPRSKRIASAKPAPVAPLFFATPAAFRAWLKKHASTASELIVGFHKVGSGKPSLTWPQSVDEALCVGWIDGVRRRLDDERYQIRFTPRRPGSHWSAINIERVRALTAEGRMTPAGLAAFAKRTEEKSGRAAYEQKGPVALSPAEEKRFRAHREAWAFFDDQPPSWRKRVVWWVTSAKQDATRGTRLAKLIAACARGERF